MLKKIRIKIKIRKIMNIIHRCDYQTQVDCIDLIHKVFISCTSYNALEHFLNKVLAGFKQGGLV